MKNCVMLCGLMLTAVFGTTHAADLPGGKSAVPACVKGVKSDVLENSKMYMKKGVKVKCSANINISYVQGPNGVAVGANSINGTTSFMGSSITGKVVPGKLCASSCTSEEASAAALAAVPAEAL